jgi:hypothetical protein
MNLTSNRTLFVTALAAAGRAVPPHRSGFAAGLNNTCRQAGTALGVACWGAIAGSPAQTDRFVAHLHVPPYRGSRRASRRWPSGPLRWAGERTRHQPEIKLRAASG